MTPRGQEAARWGLAALSVIVLLLWGRAATVDNAYFAGAGQAEDYYRAQVISASGPRSERQQIGGFSMASETFDLTARLLSGFMKGEVVTVAGQRVEYNSSARVYPYQAGDVVYVTFEFDVDGDAVWYVSDHARDFPLFCLAAGFLALLVLFGRRQGLRTVVTLVLTVAAVFFVLIPSVLKGDNLYTLTAAVALFIVATTLGIVSGVSIKSIAAAVGCAGGVGVAGALALAMQRIMKISGMVSEEASFVLLINPERPIDLRGVMFASIVIGALGAVMDVAMSIASSLEELIVYNPGLTRAELIRSGMKIGRDILGTMANTLILAYVGSSLHVILLLMAYNRTASAVFNREMVAAEVLQSVAGSVGILFAIPATTLVTTLIRGRRGRQIDSGI